MQYDMSALKADAKASGFSQSEELNTESLVFMPEVREMCAADRCNHYAKNWRCPPACGSIEDAAAEAALYHCGLLVQTIGKMEDDFDYEAIEYTSGKHKERFALFVKILRGRFGSEKILPLGAGTCTLCAECSYPDAPCRRPGESFSSMEAYGLWVSKVCELSGLPYNNGTRTITFTSCLLFR